MHWGVPLRREVRRPMTIQRERYPFADSMRLVCTVLKISPERVLRRAGLPDDALVSDTRGVMASEWFSLMNATVVEYGKPDWAMRLGHTFAHGPFVAPIFAFSCSQTVELGLQRLALFKPLMGPIALDVQRREDAVVVSFLSTCPDVPLPAACARFEAVYFLECCRIFTGEHIVPLAIRAPGDAEGWQDLVSFLEVTPEPAETLKLTLSPVDLTRPLITQNEEMWASFEVGLRKKLLNHAATIQMSERVRNALLVALPGGQSSVDDVCSRLHVSKRTLQRKLKDEGTSFQKILDETRSELSVHYLKQKSLSVVEISYLLGFQDPGSFYRAFHTWTGQTPADMRSRLVS